MEQPRTISVSQVNAYLGCPLKYRFQYVDKIPRPWRAAAMAFGSSVHAAVEWFHRERLVGKTPDLAEVLKVFDADWYAQNVEPLVFSERESREALAEKGRGMIQLYVESTNGTMPTAVEQPFELDLADPETGELLDVRLRGVIDLIEDGDVLVDLKTAGRTLEAGGLDRHLQLSTYALAYLLLHGNVPKLRLDMLLKTVKPRLERHETTRSVEDLSWTARLIREVSLAIQTEHFFPNPSWRCTECEYFAHCQQWRGTWPLPSEQLVTVESGEGVGESVGA
jgi:putative RecB family exonuclease